MISVVIPAFNAETFLSDAVNSVLSQSVPAREIVIVDDGSQDATLDVARSFGDRVIVIDQDNRGVSAARNAGAERVTSGWVMFLDADDMLKPDAFENMLAQANDDRFGVIYGAVLEFDPVTGEQHGRGGGNSAGLPPSPALANFPRAVIVTPGCALVRTDLHRRIGGFTKPWQPTEDRDYWMKLGVLTGFSYCDKVVLSKRIHANQSVRKLARTMNWGMLVQLEYLDWLDEQGIDKSFLATSPRRIAHDAIIKAYRRRNWQALSLILESLRSKGIDSPLITAARLIPWSLMGTDRDAAF